MIAKLRVDNVALLLGIAKIGVSHPLASDSRSKSFYLFIQISNLLTLKQRQIQCLVDNMLVNGGLIGHHATHCRHNQAESAYQPSIFGDNIRTDANDA